MSEISSLQPQQPEAGADFGARAPSPAETSEQRIHNILKRIDWSQVGDKVKDEAAMTDSLAKGRYFPSQFFNTWSDIQVAQGEIIHRLVGTTSRTLRELYDSVQPVVIADAAEGTLYSLTQGILPPDEQLTALPTLPEGHPPADQFIGSTVVNVSKATPGMRGGRHEVGQLIVYVQSPEPR